MAERKLQLCETQATPLHQGMNMGAQCSIALQATCYRVKVHPKESKSVPERAGGSLPTKTGMTGQRRDRRRTPYRNPWGE